jgi:hypothetical protein
MGQERHARVRKGHVQDIEGHARIIDRHTLGQWGVNGSIRGFHGSIRVYMD